MRPIHDFYAQTVGTGKSHGGATLLLDPYALVEAGTPVYFVGGEPDRDGRRIPTVKVRREDFTPERALIETVCVGLRTDAPDVAVGSWVNPDTGMVEIDATGIYTDRETALRVATERGELAIWDNAAGEAIYTDVSVPA